MPSFRYIAVSAEGKKQKGVLLAESVRDARQNLQARALFPLELSEANGPALGSHFGSFVNRAPAISSRDRALVTRQLATMLGSGVSIDDALRSIAAQSTKAVVKDVLTNVMGHVIEGRKLSEAMAAQPASFDPLYVAMVSAGEMSGDLAAILERIADYAEKTEHVRSRVKAALVYPAVLATVALGVLALLVYVVVPRIAQQFESFETQLPLPTRLVIGVSEFFATYGGFVVIALVLAVIGTRVFLANPARRLSLHRGLLGLPFIGRYMQTFASARFARTLGTLIDGGSPALEAIKAARETQGNMHLRTQVDRIYDDVFKGRPLGTAFRDATAFAPLLIYMVAMGEKTGALSTLLMRAADYLEQEVDIATQGFLSLLEPLIVIIMGLMVGFIVMAIMLPIMQLNTLILN